ncbi:MAG: HEAT repeat domain-containing protein [Deltaproteobacteria bacterium]|nr:HEAT repeat domain-containing protein [Deltaproteobacteria bacterium]
MITKGFRGSALVLGALLILLAPACGGGAYRRAERLDTIEAWRAFLAEPSSDDEEIAFAHARIDTLAWARAKKAKSIEGYKRYLEEVPRAAHRLEAEEAMAKLRFARLQPDSSRPELEDYLRRHPEGARSDEVKARLVELLRQEALASGEIGRLERWSGDNPGAPGTDAVVAELDRLRFEAARAAGTTLALQAYLARFPRGQHREEAEILLAGRALRAAHFEGELERARKILASAPAAGRAQLAETDVRARYARALRRLDREALEALAAAGPEDDEPVPEEIARAAKDVLEQLGKGKAAKGLSADAAWLDAPHAGLGWPALEAALKDPDARRRWVGARALGYSRSTRALAPLIDLLEDRDLRVAASAADALQRLAESLDPLVRDVALTERLHAIEPKAASPERRATVAVLREAAGAGGILPRLRAAAEGGARLADLRLLELSDDPREKRVALGRLATALRERTSARLDRLEGALRGAAIEPADLRAARTALWLGRHLLEVQGRVGAAGEAPKWVADLEVQKARLEALLPRVEGRYRLSHPEFLDFDLDEGEARRAKEVELGIEALRRLRAAGGVACEALRWAAGAPHPALRAAAREPGPGAPACAPVSSAPVTPEAAP